MTTIIIHPHKAKNAEILTKVAYEAYRSITQAPMSSTHHENPRIGKANDNILPSRPKTGVCIWCSAWIGFFIVAFLILASIIILVVFLLFHPKLPHFQIEDAHLNTIRLDPNTFLFNSEMVSLVRFNNTNAKVGIIYEYLNFKLYFRSDLIATQVLEPFEQERRDDDMKTLDLISTDVELKALNAQILINQATIGKKIVYQLIGTFKTKAKLGPIVRLPYWLYADCQLTIVFPNGTLSDHSCRTRR